ncbi:MAG TPA: BBE domain-containing protein [Trebonia sp.]
MLRIFLTRPRKRDATLVSWASPGLWRHAAITGEELLGLFGAAFWTGNPGSAPAWQVLFDCVHLAGLALVIVGFVLALRWFFRADSLLAAGLAAGIVLNVAAFMTSKYATDLLSAREVAAVLPFSAVLAGRMVPGYLHGARLRKLGPVPVPVPVLAAVGLAYAAILVVNSVAARPAAPAEQNVAEWLAGHHLSSGLALSYWMSNIVTVESGDRVKVRDATVSGGAVTQPGYWETNTQWYDPSVSTADSCSPTPGAARLVEVKTRYDPANIFRFNANICPRG